MVHFKCIYCFLLKLAPFNIPCFFFVCFSVEQLLATMALARLGKCVRPLLLDSSKAVFYGSVKPAWIVSCVGGKTRKIF